MTSNINKFSNCQNAIQAIDYLTTHDVEVQIGKHGGRIYKINKENFRLNEIVKIIKKIVANPKLETPGTEIRNLIRLVNNLDEKGDEKLKKAQCLQKFCTFFKRLFGNLGFNRKRVMRAFHKSNFSLVLCKEEALGRATLTKTASEIIKRNESKFKKFLNEYEKVIDELITSDNLDAFSTATEKLENYLEQDNFKNLGRIRVLISEIVDRLGDSNQKFEMLSVLAKQNPILLKLVVCHKSVMTGDWFYRFKREALRLYVNDFDNLGLSINDMDFIKKQLDWQDFLRKNVGVKKIRRIFKKQNEKVERDQQWGRTAGVNNARRKFNICKEIAQEKRLNMQGQAYNSAILNY